MISCFFFLYRTSVSRGLYFGSHFIPKPSWDLQTYGPVPPQPEYLELVGLSQGTANTHMLSSTLSQQCLALKHGKREVMAFPQAEMPSLQRAQADRRGPMFNVFFFFLLIIQ